MSRRSGKIAYKNVFRNGEFLKEVVGIEDVYIEFINLLKEGDFEKAIEDLESAIDGEFLQNPYYKDKPYSKIIDTTVQWINSLKGIEENLKCDVIARIKEHGEIRSLTPEAVSENEDEDYTSPSKGVSGADGSSLTVRSRSSSNSSDGR